VARTSALPDVDFAAVVIVFGTVELVRGVEDPDTFRVAVNDITNQLVQKYPNAKITALGVPRRRNTLNVWYYEGQRHLDALNDILKQLNGVAFIDSTQILERVMAGSETYDGVHFTDESYILLVQSVQKILGQSY
jgi:hypothetical protein